MKEIFWDSGHLGWGIFALVVFSGLWLLFADLGWRLLVMKSRRLLALLGMGWLIGVMVILLGFVFANR